MILRHGLVTPRGLRAEKVPAAPVRDRPQCNEMFDMNSRENIPVRKLCAPGVKEETFAGM